jgi:hypothetical protein
MASPVGFIFRGRIVAQLIAGVIVSIAFSAVLEWGLWSPDEWSWRYPITSLAYLFAPAVLFIGAPTLLAALLVGRLLEHTLAFSEADRMVRLVQE